eukprot:TRINITY_DN10286_c0_g1_i1.p1 TRINITY_DN10286_c0_g1~~TRINITY_DN10286_c0_g1_i1.p1  ORF type:complete len:828 (+),score=78.44 TRINITY_DN10286_c0_g1_i1:315-2486(+)
MVYSAGGTSLAFTPVFRLNQAGVLVQLASSITYNDGTTVAPFDREPPCSPGFHYVVEQRGCLICPKGKTCVGARFPAIPCAPGTAAPFEGLTQCIDCPIGTTSQNGSACVACDPGFGAPAEAMAACTPCSAGTSWRTVPAPNGTDSRLKIVEVAMCEICGVGEYARQGDLSCTKCAASHTTTRFRGSTRHEECVCKQGYYRPCNGDATSCPKNNYSASDARPCLPCPEGMTCVLGSDMVNLKMGIDEDYAVADPGYMTMAADPLSVYLCKPVGACPGGKPDTCAAGRVGVSCGTCPAGLSMVNGFCEHCSGSHWVGLIIYVFCVFIGVALVYATSGSGHSWRGNPAVSLSMALRIILRIVQILAVFTLTTVNWPAPIWNGLQTVAFVDFSAPFTCIAKANVVAKYIGGMFTMPIAAICVLIIFYLSKLRPVPWSVGHALTAWGKICAVLFVSQLTLCMLPFMCYTHPNGSKSVLRYSSTVCGTSDHVYMSVVASVGLVIAIAFVAFCAYKTFRMQKIVEADDAQHQLERIMFLVDDFRTGMFSAFVWMRLEDFFIALTVVLVPDDSRLQIMFFFCVTMVSATLTSVCSPWKFPFHNVMNVLLQFEALVLLLLGKDYVPGVGNDYVGSVTYVLAVGFVLSVSFTMLVLVPAVNRIVRGQKGEMFIITNLGSFPSEEEITKLWKSVSTLSSDDLHSALSMWQVYDVIVFQKTMEALTSKRTSIGG